MSDVYTTIDVPKRSHVYRMGFRYAIMLPYSHLAVEDAKRLISSLGQPERRFQYQIIGGRPERVDDFGSPEQRRYYYGHVKWNAPAYSGKRWLAFKNEADRTLALMILK